MKPRTVIPLVIGLAVGFFAIKMGIDMVQKAKGSPGDQVNVLVTSRAIDVATPITETMLTTKAVPKALVPSDTFTDPKALKGRITAMSIANGVAVTASMLAAPGAEAGLRSKIPAGLRAVSISVTEESAVGGFLMPGSRVDVYSGGEGKENPHSQLVISDVEVGAVGQSMNEVDKDGKTVRITKSVTLFLRPEEVEQLPAGRRNLRLALRGSGKPVAKEGQDRGNGDPSFWESVFARAKEKPAAAPASPKQRVLEVVRGKEIENLTFIETGGPGQYELVNSDAPQGKSVGKPERAKPARPPSPE